MIFSQIKDMKFLCLLSVSYGSFFWIHRILLVFFFPEILCPTSETVSCRILIDSGYVSEALWERYLQQVKGLYSRID